MSMPFPLPERLSPSLQPVYSYWQGLRRGGNDIPFWDDVTLSALPERADDLFLIDAFAMPERFRIASAGQTMTALGAIGGRFADELDSRGPLRFLRAQASAAVEGRKPTYFRSEGEDAFARLILPLWGDGRVSMLLGAIGEAA
jgi:hypothetical protein